jgi:pimeloyl-ACP methyl ester carboxylesterase
MADWTTTPDGLIENTFLRRGCDLHYWVGGPAGSPVIAMMHGATMDHRMWNAQVEALIEDYRLVVWDARGQGVSRPIGEAFSLEECAADMLAILDRERIDSTVLMGQSLGGMIAQHVYRQALERVQALVIFDSTPVFTPNSAFEVAALKASAPAFNLWPYGHFTRTVARSIALSKDVQVYALGAIGQMSREDFLSVWKDVSLAIDTTGWPGFHISCPLLLLLGDHDSAGTIRRDMPRWAALDPAYRLVIIPNASHNANQDNPEASNAVVREFLSGVFEQPA